MIKKIAWNTFKNTGDINAFLEFKQIQGIENQLQQMQGIQLQNIQQNQGFQLNNGLHQMEEQYGNNQNEWNNNL